MAVAFRVFSYGLARIGQESVAVVKGDVEEEVEERSPGAMLHLLGRVVLLRLVEPIHLAFV